MRITLFSIIGLLLVFVVSVSPVWGKDFSAYTNDELASMRGTMQNATDDERNAFRKEWQKRLRSMTQEEYQKHIGRPANAPADGSGDRLNRLGRGGASNQQTNVERGGSGYGKGGGMRQRNRGGRR